MHRLRDDSQRQGISVVVMNDKRDIYPLAAATGSRCVASNRRMVWICPAAIRTLVTRVATDLKAPPKMLRSEIRGERPVCLRARQHRAAIIRPVTILAGRCPSAFNRIGMRIDPGLSDWMHS